MSRVIVVTDDFPPLPGGVATWTEAVAAGLHAAGDEVVVYARARPGLVTPTGVRVVGVRGVSFGRLGPLWTAFSVAPRLRRGDVVLATTWPMAHRLLAVCRAAGVTLQVALHGSEIARPPTPARSFQEVMTAAARRFAVSGYLAELVRSMGFACEVLPAPVDAGPPAAPGPGFPTRWLLVARATPLKGGDRVVRLAAACRAELTVIGDGPALAGWRELASAVGANARFTGALGRAEIRGALRDHDLALLLPRTERDGTGAEGLGLVLLEAAAHGIAAVGCRTGGVPEAAGPGLILDDPDDVDASAAALRGWWTPARGEEARRWLAATHGVARTVGRLRGEPSGVP